MQTLTLEQILPVGVTVLAGKPKSGKTSLALEVAIALAGGPSRLQLPVNAPSDVLYLTFDTNARELWGHADQRSPSNQPWTRRLFVSDVLPCGAKSLKEALLRWSEDVRPPHVVIDPVQGLPAAATAENYLSQFTAVTELHGLALVFAIRILAVAHTRAAEEVPSGSGGAESAGDAIWRIEYSPAIEHLALTVVGRDFPRYDLPLNWDAGRLTWRTAGQD